MDDLISRQAAISALCNACGKIDCDKMDKCEKLQLPPANCSEFPNSSDCINRQAAIDELKRISFSHWFECGEYLSEDTREIEIINSKKALEAIEALPSAQPEIIHCKDCKHFGVDRYKKLTWCSRINYGYGYQANDFCSKAERRTDEGSD